MSDKTVNGDKFLQWIDSIGQNWLALRLGVTRGAVWNWRHKMNKPTPDMARRLIEIADGALTFEDIYGD